MAETVANALVVSTGNISDEPVVTDDQLVEEELLAGNIRTDGGFALVWRESALFGRWPSADHSRMSVPVTLLGRRPERACDESPLADFRTA